jgi:protein involved in polysaccharide export with SLBB domain
MRRPDGRPYDGGASRGPDPDAPSRPLPPLEPSDFQRFVQAGTGKMLPIFGIELFQDAPSTFAPAGNISVPAEYVIGPGDELVIRSTGVLDFELRPTVDRDGQVVIPKVGPVSVAGIKRADLEKHLTQHISRSFRNFNLSATLGELRSIDVYVVGQARRPGKYTVSSLATLVNALFASGGPNANGSMRQIRLVRDNRPLVTFDLYAFIGNGDKSKDVRLMPGDVIVFPSAGPRVAVGGTVNTPAIFELTGNSATVRTVLAASGGLPVLASPLKVQLERIDSSAVAARQVEDFALDAAGMERVMRDGDVLTVLAIAPQFSNAVTLRGNVAQPMRHVHRAGMRVRDLIPDREALITRDYYVRKNRLVQGDEPVGKVDVEKARQDVRSMLDEVNWDYAVIERLDRTELRTQLIPFNLGRAVLHQDESQNLELLPGDVVTVFGMRDLRAPRSRQTRLVRVEGEVGTPGIYTVGSGETLPDLLTRVGGVTADAYVFGTELRRESVRLQQQQNLETIVRRLEDQVNAGLAARQTTLSGGDAAQQASQAQRLAVEEKLARERLQRLRSMKPSGRVSLELNPESPALPALTLEDGDRVVVPPRPSFVSVVGAVYNENVLVWRSGRTVGAYLESAGLTDSADSENVFVLRADGSIASKRDTGWFGGGGIVNLVLAAGDTIVVPEKVDRETNYQVFMRGLKDWTQVIYQLGLGAAAIKVLRD